MANIDLHFLNANTRFCYPASTSSFHLTKKKHVPRSVKYYRNMMGKLREQEMLWECEYCFHAAFVYCVVPCGSRKYRYHLSPHGGGGGGGGGVICKF